MVHDDSSPNFFKYVKVVIRIGGQGNLLTLAAYLFEVVAFLMRIHCTNACAFCMLLQCCQLNYLRYHFRSKIDEKCQYAMIVIFRNEIDQVGNTGPYHSDKFVVFKYLS